MIKQSEHDIQVRFVKYLDFKKVLYSSTANGIFLKDRKTAHRIMNKMKAEGLKTGLPDILIFEPRGGFNGLMIELKSKTGKTSDDQKKWIKALNDRGYKALVCKGLDSAINSLETYLALK